MGRNSSPDYSKINVPYTDYTSHLCYTSVDICRHEEAEASGSTFAVTWLLTESSSIIRKGHPVPK